MALLVVGRHIVGQRLDPSGGQVRRRLLDERRDLVRIGHRGRGLLSARRKSGIAHTRRYTPQGLPASGPSGSENSRVRKYLSPPPAKCRRYSPTLGVRHSHGPPTAPLRNAFRQRIRLLLAKKRLTRPALRSTIQCLGGFRPANGSRRRIKSWGEKMATSETPIEREGQQKAMIAEQHKQAIWTDQMWFTATTLGIIAFVGTLLRSPSVSTLLISTVLILILSCHSIHLVSCHTCNVG